MLRPRAFISVTVAFFMSGVATTVADEFHSTTFPASKQNGELQIGVTYRIWIPETKEKLRGIIVHQHGCGVGACTGGKTAADDLHWQALARKWNCGLLGPSYHQSEDDDCRLWCDPRNGSGEVFIAALERLSQESGHPEIATIPWCIWGHSGGGYWASLLQMQHPDRIVAIWFQSGTAHSRWVTGEIEAPTIPRAAMNIPMMACPGVEERDHERFKSAWFGCLEMFQDYRSRRAPIAFAPDPKSGHETRDSRYLAIPFFDACLELRLPARIGLPLREIDRDQAWLATAPLNPREPPTTPMPHNDFTGNRRKSVWLPNAKVAKAWSDFIRSGDVSDTTGPPTPKRVEVKQLDQGTKLTWQAEADLDSGIRAFEIYKDEQLIGRVPEQPSTRFGRPLFQSMSYHDTPRQPLPSMQFLDSEGTLASAYSIKTINSAGLSSAAAAASIHRDIVFAELEEQNLKLDIYMPKETANPTLVVWIHGGGWRAGSKNHPPIRKLIEHDYAVASISYRFTDKAIFPAQLHDCKAAIRWLRAHSKRYGYDADWIAVAGGSAGGHLALLLGVTGGEASLEGGLDIHQEESSAVQAIVDYFGPSDFVLRGETQPDRAYTEKSGSFALLGGLKAGSLNRETEAFASPASYVTADDPPLLAFHGSEDKVVLLDQSQRIIELYNAANLSSQLVVVAEAGHGGEQFFSGENFETLLAFLQRSHAVATKP